MFFGAVCQILQFLIQLIHLINNWLIAVSVVQNIVTFLLYEFLLCNCSTVQILVELWQLTSSSLYIGACCHKEIFVWCFLFIYSWTVLTKICNSLFVLFLINNELLVLCWQRFSSLFCSLLSTTKFERQWLPNVHDLLDMD